MIDLKNIHAFIIEFYKFGKDIPLFFMDGKKYFEKIENDDLTTNIYRLVNYVVLHVLIGSFLLSATLSFDYSLLESARMLIFQIPIISLGYFIALSFSDIPNKVKTCLNYVVFQNTITTLISTLLLAGFVHSEVYFFYILYAISMMFFVVFVLSKFALLFFKSRLKRVLSILAVIITTAMIGLTGNYLEIHATSKATVAFEDPIASEFFALDCFNETENVNRVVNSSLKKTKQIIENIDTMLTYINSNPSIQNEAAFFIDSKAIQKLAYVWNVDKEKEYQRVNDKISTIEKKIQKARYDHTKRILYKNLETYIEYKDFLDVYNRTLILLSNIDYENISNIKRNNLEVPMNDVAYTMNNVRGVIINNQKIDLMELKILVIEKDEKLAQKHIDVTTEIFSYLEFIKKIKKYLPVYLYDPTPLPKY